jgi:hypothetical protein
MNNPVTRGPAGADRYALWPDPPGCTGHRLFCMLRAARPGTTEDDYADAFDRMNLVAGPWSLAHARVRVQELLPHVLGRRVVLLGVQVRAAFGHSAAPPAYPYRTSGADFFQLPHPSGRNPWYNAADNRALAGRLLADLYDEGVAK